MFNDFYLKSFPTERERVDFILKADKKIRNLIKNPKNWMSEELAFLNAIEKWEIVMETAIKASKIPYDDYVFYYKKFVKYTVENFCNLCQFYNMACWICPVYQNKTNITCSDHFEDFCHIPTWENAQKMLKHLYISYSEKYEPVIVRKDLLTYC